VMLNHYATCVARDGRLYGFDGRQERGPALACVDLATGRPLWRKENFGAGVLLLAGDRLLILLETGELILAKADPGAYRELFRAHILGSETRAYPALANGYFYARDKTKLACFDLRPR
jgi:outer membrane protein assembly factor BamB